MIVPLKIKSSGYSFSSGCCVYRHPRLLASERRLQRPVMSLLWESMSVVVEFVNMDFVHYGFWFIKHRSSFGENNSFIKKLDQVVKLRMISTDHSLFWLLVRCCLKKTYIETNTFNVLVPALLYTALQTRWGKGWLTNKHAHPPTLSRGHNHHISPWSDITSAGIKKSAVQKPQQYYNLIRTILSAVL